MKLLNWRKYPELTARGIRGQIDFWDLQAPTYSRADMTVDNESELNIVLQKSREVSLKEIVTLGGADGYRDPRVILKDLLGRNGDHLVRVTFSDLSRKMVERARENLDPLLKEGDRIVYMQGSITRVCRRIKKSNRRLTLGCYGFNSFVENMEGEDLHSGVSCYLNNHKTLGEQFYLEWVALSERNELVSIGVCCHLHYQDPIEIQEAVRDILRSSHHSLVSKGVEVIALQIRAVHPKREKSPFLSHWYTEKGIKTILNLVFSEENFVVNIDPCEKGFVVTVDPRDKEVTGIITVLNNVIGNVLPREQYKSLLAIRSIMS
jgi:SAM-dependent methyltransferase